MDVKIKAPWRCITRKRSFTFRPDWYAVIVTAVSRHDSIHPLIVGPIVSRFPEVPTIQLIGFPYLPE